MKNPTTFTMLLLMMWNIFTHAWPGNSSSSNATSTNNGGFDLLIVGGSKTLGFNHDFVVGLRSSGSLGIFCGGALIAPRVVLTAAHCVKSDMMANIGSKLADGRGGQKIRVERSIRHPKWSGAPDSSQEYDVAVLILKDSASPKLAPIVLDRSPGSFSAGTSVRVFGWGTMKENEDSQPHVLRQVELPIVNSAVCQKMIKRAIHPSMLCAGGEEGRDSCQGDSGGPLVFYNHRSNTKNPTLVGIVSFGIGCGRANLPGVYSRVEYVHDWILQTMEEFGLSME